MQKLELKRTSGGILACAVLAISGAAFATPALAAADTSNAASTPAVTTDSGQRADHNKSYRKGEHRRGHKHRHGHMRDAAMLIPGYGPVPEDVLKSLALNPEQTALLDDAKTFVKEQRKAMRDNFRKTRGDKSERTVSTPLDPHAAVKMQEERVSAMRDARAEGTQKWLALWDSLESGQQDTLNEYVVKRSEERANRRAEHKEKRAARHSDKS